MGIGEARKAGKCSTPSNGNHTTTGCREAWPGRQEVVRPPLSLPQSGAGPVVWRARMWLCKHTEGKEERRSAAIALHERLALQQKTRTLLPRQTRHGKALPIPNAHSNYTSTPPSLLILPASHIHTLRTHVPHACMMISLPRPLSSHATFFPLLTAHIAYILHHA